MKTSTKNYSLFTLLIWLFSPSTFLLANLLNPVVSENGKTSVITANRTAQQIHLALLLDTSNSMDGLIEQAKSQLWNVVDELADAQYNGQPADLYIALYEYGNDGLSIRNNYIRQVSGFTQDLDEISTQLFNLQTNGGSEYCGAVIHQSLKELAWSTGRNDLRMIFIAGNEPFDQGGIDYRNVCSQASEKDISVNTIFCGDYQEGIETFWAKGAKLGNGKYMNIDMDQKTIYVSTPYDQEIDQLNDKLNNTYVAYGKEGQLRKDKQAMEDNNAASYSRANKVKRTISKSKHVYKNDSWDLVDAKQGVDFDLSKISKEELPEEMKGMTIEEKEKYLESKSKERKLLQQDIQRLGKLRKAYITQVNDSLALENELEQAILRSVKSVAQEKDFTFKE